MDLEFNLNTARIKLMARSQMQIDETFAKEIIDLRRKLYLRKISGLEFWEEYKQSLKKSLEKNEKTFQDLIEKTDKKMKEGFTIAEKNQGSKPVIDLKLPE